MNPFNKEKKVIETTLKRRILISYILSFKGSEAI